MLRFSQIYCNNKKNKKQKQNANKNAQIHNTNTTKTRIANLHRYIYLWHNQGRVKKVKFAFGLSGSRSLILFGNRRIACCFRCDTSFGWNYVNPDLGCQLHTNNLFDSFNFTSKTEDKVNKPKNKKRQYTKANTVDKFPNTIVACSPDQVVSTTENFHKESTKAKKVLPHSARPI